MSTPVFSFNTTQNLRHLLQMMWPHLQRPVQTAQLDEGSQLQQWTKRKMSLNQRWDRCRPSRKRWGGRQGGEYDHSPSLWIRWEQQLLTTSLFIVHGRYLQQCWESGKQHNQIKTINEKVIGNNVSLTLIGWTLEDLAQLNSVMPPSDYNVVSEEKYNSTI